MIDTGSAPPSAASVRAPGTFAALREPAYRRFFIGQGISLPGTWMQTIGQSWLVLELTGSGTYLGLLTAAQFLPVLLLAPYGGLLADRLPKRILLLATQSVMCLSAFGLGILTVLHLVSVGAVLVAAVLLGIATAVDNPTRQAFVIELVGPRLVVNAVSLNSVLVNAARAVGPAIAGVMIAAVGVGWCFLINAASFAGILVALAWLRLPDHRPTTTRTRALSQLRDGFGYTFREPRLLWPFLLILLVGTFAWEFPITLPMLTRDAFDNDARVYGWLTSAMGIGAILGGLVVARLARTGLAAIAGAAAVFGAGILLLALAPGVPTAIGALFVVGIGSTAFMSISNATMQLSSAPEYRGRVMSLWSMSFSGSTPIGGPIVGAVGEHSSPRWALGLGALSCLVAVVLSLGVTRSLDRRSSQR
ncbi:MAG: MFS transporter [Nocardioides sp.]|uniref:MFS transporter n=1 Tax=Nocardioides sp. TaxID=35761 RepID=UPI0039E3E617